MRYLVDTDWAIDYLAGVERIVGRIDELRTDGIAISIVSVAELYEGAFYARDPIASEQALQRFIAPLDVLGLDDQICRLFAEERGRLRASGSIIGDFDILIGATAMRHGLAVLTNNRRHFSRLQGIEIADA